MRRQVHISDFLTRWVLKPVSVLCHCGDAYDTTRAKKTFLNSFNLRRAEKFWKVLQVLELVSVQEAPPTIPTRGSSTRLSAVKEYWRPQLRRVVWAVALGVVLRDQINFSWTDRYMRQRRVRVTAVLDSYHAPSNAVAN